MRKLAMFALGVLIAFGAVGAAQAYDNCTPQVHIAYDGATAAAVSLIQAATELYGAPLSQCGSSNLKTWQAMVDLTGDGTKDTCVRFYMGQNRGSCEGVEALDRRESNFNVCQPVAGSTTQVSLSTLTDELGAAMFFNMAGSDVGASLCEPVVLSATLTRPSIFTDTEQRAFVIPFVMIANKQIRTILPARKVINPPGGSCPAGIADCPRVDISLSPGQINGIYGNNSICDWRSVDESFLQSPVYAIGAVMRNCKSGTRRNFNATMLGAGAMGQGAMFVAGTGDVQTAVNGNQWCVTNPAACGETAPSACTAGGQTTPCAGVSANAISLGPFGVDRLKTVDPGTPSDPFDDYGVRGNASDTYDVLGFQGAAFNKARVRCGRYEYWSYERLYYDNVYMAPGTAREAAVLQLITQEENDALSDTNVVALSQMYVKRARDGGPVSPNGAYNTFCNEP